jgi:hypothetical protein
VTLNSNHVLNNMVSSNDNEYMLMPASANPHSNQQRHRYPQVTSTAQSDQLPSLIQVHRKKQESEDSQTLQNTSTANSNQIRTGILQDVNLYSNNASSVVAGAMTTGGTTNLSTYH